jgi:hypothetical protein
MAGRRHEPTASSPASRVGVARGDGRVAGAPGELEPWLVEQESTANLSGGAHIMRVGDEFGPVLALLRLLALPPRAPRWRPPRRGQRRANAARAGAGAGPQIEPLHLPRGVVVGISFF